MSENLSNALGRPLQLSDLEWMTDQITAVPEHYLRSPNTPYQEPFPKVKCYTWLALNDDLLERMVAQAQDYSVGGQTVVRIDVRVIGRVLIRENV